MKESKGVLMDGGCFILPAGNLPVNQVEGENYGETRETDRDKGVYVLCSDFSTKGKEDVQSERKSRAVSHKRNEGAPKWSNSLSHPRSSRISETPTRTVNRTPLAGHKERSPPDGKVQKEEKIVLKK